MRWLPLFAVVAACSNMQDVVRDKDRGGGAARVYPVSEDQAWKISETILRLSEIDRVVDHRSEGYLLAVVDAGPLSSGTYLGVWLEPVGAGAAQTKVTFVRRRKVATQTLRTLTEETFHRQFQTLTELAAATSKGCSTPASSATPAAAPASSTAAP
jgi:hypothetical protein